MLQHWDDEAVTHEIAIIGPKDENFANRGDSRGLGNIAFAIPLHLIVCTAGDYYWA
ncbi:hypothetical protein HOY80DRAFT_1058947 [Tuber brumale]|nr:hypothetical protein HOY80DRAFT_1058947 [Tuber brumale]